MIIAKIVPEDINSFFGCAKIEKKLEVRSWKSEESFSI